jgi:peptide/nickel transport system substrate-binding protein
VGEAQVRVLFLCFIAACVFPAQAATFRWSSQGDYLSADPHAQNEGINNLVNGEIFERLTTRDKQLKIIPGLATSWEMVNPKLWRFHLRHGVTFHDGTPFTADDVVFSIGRAQGDGSNFKVFARPLGTPRRVDDYTVELATPQPAPPAVLLENVNTIFIASRAWCEKHGAVAPQDLRSGDETYASRNANGTGPYLLAKREAEVATTLERNPRWWGNALHRFEGNVDRIEYRPIKSDATRLAALVAGDIDLMLDPPPQDIARLAADPRLAIVEGPENRVIYLAMDEASAALKYSSVKAGNPFKDLRVRKAIYAAIDTEAIRRQVMRGEARPTGSMIPAPDSSFPDLEARLVAYDPGRARELLAEAGYPRGFEVGFDCPNNRYVNDERICIAVTGMLAKVGITAQLDAMPRAKFFRKVDLFDSSFHLLGWGGGATDPGGTLTAVMHGRDGSGRGDFNTGRYDDPALNRQIEAIETETDTAKRRAMIHDAFARIRDEVFVIPLHRQVIPWAVRKGVHVVHRADNVVEAVWIRID